MQFCQSIIDKINRDDHFLQHVIFTDESSFPLTHDHNRATVRYWSKENEHRSIPSRSQYRHKLNVWAGLLGSHVVGPFFIDGVLPSQKYIIQAFPDINIQNVYFQQDGCPVHNALRVANYLQEQFPHRWIGTNTDRISWPARSPDLSPLDFFYWGYLEQKIYGHENTRPANLQELEDHILNTSNNITPQMLDNVRSNFYDRLGFCLAKNGGIFEPCI